MKRPNTSLEQLNDGEAFDVVVIGGGGAGMSAALFASLEGARVLLVESTEYLGGTTALSAATSWVPCTAPGLAVNPDDTPERAMAFLDHAVGERSDRRMRERFIEAGPQAVATLEARSRVRYQVRPLHPDYLSELPGAVLSGRAIEPRPFDARLLGEAMTLVRPPIPEFTVLGGMMVDRDDIFHLLRAFKTIPSLAYVVRILLRHWKDKLFYPRATRWVMGNALIGRLLLSLLEQRVCIVTRTSLVSLRREAGAITGLRLRETGARGASVGSAGTERLLTVHGGVILASGGFNRDPARRAHALPGIDPQWSPAAPGHTGQAQSAALAAGAALGEDGMSPAFWAPVSLRTRGDGSTAAFPHFAMDRGKPGMVAVDAAGRRFVNESTSYHLFGLAMQAQGASASRIPTWLVCDAAALRRYGMGMIRPGESRLQPHLRDGYVLQAPTVLALGRQMGTEAGVLEATVERFNGFARSGADLDFQRGSTDYQRANGDSAWPGPNPCLGELREGPFYALRLYPGDIGAATGLACDVDARVLDAQGQFIAGLYACGNDMHSIMGGVYPAPGITIGPGLVFGHLAALHATRRAREPAVSAHAPT